VAIGALDVHRHVMSNEDAPTPFWYAVNEPRSCQPRRWLGRKLSDLREVDAPGQQRGVVVDRLDLTGNVRPGDTITEAQAGHRKFRRPR